MDANGKRQAARTGIARAPAALAVVLFAVTAAHLGMGLGYANNGDFWRSMQPSGIVYRSGLAEQDIFWKNVHRTYQLGPLPPNPVELTYSPNDWVIRAALLLQKVAAPEATRSGVFHLFSVSALHLTIAAAFVAAAWRRLTPSRRWLAAAILWVAADPYYSLFLGSFYSEALSLVSLLGLVLALLGSPPSIPLAVIALGLFTFSKAQFLLTPVLLAAVCYALGHRWSARRMVAAGAILAAGAAFLLTRIPHRELTRVNRFHSAFYGVASASADGAATVKRLGFREQAAALVGRSLYQPETKPLLYPELDAELDGYSRFRAVAVHLLEPGAVVAVLRRAAEELRQGRIAYLGQYEESYGRPLEGVCGAGDFCGLRLWLTGWAWPVYWIAIAGGLAAVALVPALAGLRLPWLFLGLFAATQIHICFFGDGFWEFQKHLTLARFAFDVLFVGTVAMLARSVPWPTSGLTPDSR